MAKQPLVSPGSRIIKASRSHSDTPHSVGLLWTRDQLDAETSTWQHTNTHKRQTSMPATGFEPAIPPSKPPQIHAWDRGATGVIPQTWPMSSLLLTVTRLDDADTNLISLTSILKARKTLSQSARNSQLFNSNTCKSLTSNFIKIGQ
jgi:hypothetical protein